MKQPRLIGALGAAVIALIAASSVRAETVLNDWCFNINGETLIACNPIDPGSLPGNVDASGLDLTLNDPPGTANTLGSVSFTLGPGTGQSVLAYFDYDLNFGASGSFQDVASVHGSPPLGLSFELADPSGNLFADFAANALTNDNTVATGSGPPTPCCDVAWALGIGGIDVPQASQVLLIFAITNLQPQSGFYLQQTNLLSGESIYFTATVTTAVPLPGSLALLVSALAPFALAGLVRVRARPHGSSAWRSSE